MAVSKLLRNLLKMDEAPNAELPGSSGGSDTADDSTESSVNWSDIAEDVLSDDLGGVEGDAQVVEPPPAVTPPAATPPVETPPAVTPPAAVTPPTPTATPTPPAAEPQPSPAPQAAPSATPPVDYQTWRTERLTKLESEYAVAEEDAVALLTEPEKVLPKLAARVHMEVLESSMRAMQAMMPVMMTQLQQHNEVNTQAKNLFVSVNPDLADARYEPAIMQLGQVYRNVNANAAPEEAARAIGALVRSALGIAAPQAVAPQGVPAPVAPAAPVPFTPARGGGSGYQPAAPANPFEALAAEMLNEDD